MNPLLEHAALMTRRHFFGRAILALASLLNDKLFAAEQPCTEVAAAEGIHRQTVIRGMARRGISIADLRYGLKCAPSELMRSYAAGILDGEGCILINQVKDGCGHYLVVSIANKDRRLHGWLQQAFGGHVTVNDRRNPQSPCWLWNLTTRQAADFLRLVLPYLIVKREQAVIAREFQEVLRQSRKRTPERLAREAALKEKLEVLRRLGPSYEDKEHSHEM